MIYNNDIYDLSFVRFDIDELLVAYVTLLDDVEHTNGLVRAISLNRIPDSDKADPRGIFWMKDDDYKEVQREKPVDESQYSELIPEIKNTYFETVYNNLSEYFTLGRLRILLLEPRNCLSYHRDPEPWLHIPLLTNPGCLFIADNFCTHLPANGSVYYTNTLRYHTALNGGESNRIHLVSTILDSKRRTL